jgi:glycine cleavage system H protein
MSKILDNLKYAKTHEWVKVEGEFAFIGITDFAQDTLGSIVYLETGEIGTNLTQGNEFGVVESVKAASDLMTPVSGKIVEVNNDLIDNPEKLNEDPYKNWIIKIAVKDINELDNLLDAQGYALECK